MLWFNWPETSWPGVNGQTAFWSKGTLTPGKWAMCGASWNGKTVNIHINGERDNSFAASVEPIRRTGPVMVALGCDPAGSPEYYPGLMAGAMIFNRALTDYEVRQLYLMGRARER